MNTWGVEPWSVTQISVALHLYLTSNRQEHALQEFLWMNFFYLKTKKMWHFFNVHYNLGGREVKLHITADNGINQTSPPYQNILKFSEN